MVGALSVPAIFVLLRIDDRRARGIATGIAAHGFGTARALALGEIEGVFAILGMGLSGALRARDRALVGFFVEWRVRPIFWRVWS